MDELFDEYTEPFFGRSQNTPVPYIPTFIHSSTPPPLHPSTSHTPHTPHTPTTRSEGVSSCDLRRSSPRRFSCSGVSTRAGGASGRRPQS